MFAKLDDARKLKLAELLSLRIKLAGLEQEEFSKMLQLLMHYDADAESELLEYSKNVVQPVRDQVKNAREALMGEVVDAKQLEAMLPTLLRQLSRSVNLPLAFTAMGFDPNSIQQVAGLVEDLFSGDSD